MSGWKGDTIAVEIYGESHAQTIGASLYGLPAFSIDEIRLNAHLSRRKSGNFVGSTARKESDIPVISLEKDGKIRVEIQNQDVKKSDYDALYAKPRPSHADFVRFVKDGTLDFSGGGAFSGRMTAPLCAVGGIALQYLNAKGVEIYSYLSSVGSVQARSYKDGEIQREELSKLGAFPALSNEIELQEEIARAKSVGDSVGAVVECIVYGLPAGVGDCLFGGLEGKISSLVYAIPAVKGVEFGDGFAISSLTGSQANDAFVIKDGKIRTESNRSGGINGGISNGMPITLSVAFRPTPSIALPQKTVDLSTGKEASIQIQGRHDACVAIRALPAVESAVALALLDEVLKCEQ